jgi:hypothetical protein
MPKFCETCGVEHATQEELDAQINEVSKGRVDEAPIGAEALPQETDKPRRKKTLKMDYATDESKI